MLYGLWHYSVIRMHICRWLKWPEKNELLWLSCIVSKPAVIIWQLPNRLQSLSDWLTADDGGHANYPRSGGGVWWRRVVVSWFSPLYWTHQLWLWLEWLCSTLYDASLISRVTHVQISLRLGTRRCARGEPDFICHGQTAQPYKVRNGKVHGRSIKIKSSFVEMREPIGSWCQSTEWDVVDGQKKKKKDVCNK